MSSSARSISKCSEKRREHGFAIRSRLHRRTARPPALHAPKYGKLDVDRLVNSNKPSFTFFFRSEYGDDPLRYPLIPGNPYDDDFGQAVPARREERPDQLRLSKTS
ncbi:MAG: hypothetical protein R3F11_28735 [Verrucomicrobiales bacterium]